MKTFYKLSIAVYFLILSPIDSFGQKIITASSVENTTHSALSLIIKKYSLFKINTSELSRHIKNEGTTEINLILKFPGYAEFPVSIYQNDILSSNYKLIAGTANGNVEYSKPGCITYIGNFTDDHNSSVSLTISNQLIYGLLKGKNKQYFIEPLRYFEKNADASVFVIYETSDVIHRPGNGCGVTEVTKKSNELSHTHKNAKISGSATGTCKMVEVAIASDDSMYSKYGTVTAVQEHIIAVMNTVIGFYSNAQLTGPSYLEFKIVTQFVSTTPATNPYSPAYTGFQASNLLNNFRTWGQAGNFGTTYDIGQVWTAKDIASGSGNYANGTVGVGYFSAVCNTNRYHLIEDYSSDGLLLGIAVAHEIGHNFNAQHDVTGIMAPSVDISNITFSAPSLADISSFIALPAVNCLSSCNAALPIPGFNLSDKSICAGGNITVTDYSVGDVTSILWDFPGGSPASSTDASQVVTYATPGLKTITLTATNSMGPSSSSKTIFVGTMPAAACRTIFASGNDETPLIADVSLATIQYTPEDLYLNGSYLDLTCSDNTELLPGTTYSMVTGLGLEIGPDGYEIYAKVQVFIDYNNNNSFLEANENVFTSATCKQGKYNFPITTLASPPVKNTWLRMRVIGYACASAPTNGCAIPDNAQTLDYAVYFPSALPVSLIDFKGHFANGKNELYWQTASEINHQYFEIERSVGDQGLNFISIGKVNSEGINSSSLKGYSFSDDLSNISEEHLFYYRLKIVNKDGGFSYSPIIKLANPIEAENSFVLYPNPLQQGESLQVQIRNDSPATITIFNNLGQPVFTKKITETGNNTIEIPLTLASGLYIVKILEDKGSQQKALMVR